MASFLLFTLVSIAIFASAVWLAAGAFIRTNTTNPGSEAERPKRRLRAGAPVIGTRPVMQTLLMRELSRLTGSALYFVNSCFGLVIMVIGSIALPFVAPSQIEAMLEIPGFAEALSSYAPLVMGAVIATMGVTASSVSLEGRSLWLIRSAPLSERRILWSKVMLGTLIVVPAVLIACVPLWLSLKPSLGLGVLMVTEPITMALLMAEVGLILNLAFPKVDWITEVEVVKQSMAVLATLAAGAALAAVPFFAMKWVAGWSPAGFVLAVNLAYVALAAAAGYLINTWGVTRWNRIG
jgi:ABC-2 type transport system permease protein